MVFTFSVVGAVWYVLFYYIPFNSVSFLKTLYLFYNISSKTGI